MQKLSEDRIYADRIAGSKVDHKTKDTFQYHETCYGVGDHQRQGHARQWTGTYEYRIHETYRADSTSVQTFPIDSNSTVQTGASYPSLRRLFWNVGETMTNQLSHPLQISFEPYLGYRTLLPLRGVGDSSHHIVCTFAGKYCIRLPDSRRDGLVHM